MNAHPYFLPVICTDRGQHRRRWLRCWVRRREDGSHGMSEPGSGGHQWWSLSQADLERWRQDLEDADDLDEAGHVSHVPRNAYVFWCPSCPRTPQILPPKLWLAADTLAAAGATEVDVSLVGF